MNAKDILKKAGHRPNKALDENESKILLKAYGLPVVEEHVACTQAEAKSVAQKIGYPVVVKGLGASLTHKTEKGLVHLNLQDADMFEAALTAITKDAGGDLEGYLIQPYVKGRREIVAGLFRDRLFGPVVMVGIGGIFTEALSDVVFRLAPLSRADAEEMLGEIRAKTLLGAFRGEMAANHARLIQILMGISRLAMEHGEVAEVDINPLIITAKGELVAVDALVVVDSGPPAPKYLPTVDPYLLGRLFHPNAIAFVGASAQFGKWGHMLFTITASHGFKGSIYLVNPKGGTIAGRHVYPSVTDIPNKVDLAVVTVPAARVLDLIPQFKAKKIKCMLLITSGFAEIGAEGKALEEQLVAEAREAGILILGPNTMGICNPHIQLFCTGSHVWPRPGSTTIISQSGNMGTQLLAFAEQQGIGVRGYCGSGNEAMVTIEDFLEVCDQDDLTRTVMLYVESVKNGRRFFEGARNLSRKKPIVLLKGGQSEAGNLAAASHTGALTSDAGVFDAVCRQAGIIKVDHTMDLLDLAAAFSSLPLPQGNRAAIMTLGGGWGVVTADLCAAYDIAVPQLSEGLIQEINKLLPPYWSRANPLDLVGEMDNNLAMVILEALLKWDGCDVVINLGIMGRRLLGKRLADSVLKADPTYSPDFVEYLNREMIAFEEKYVTHIVNLMEKYQKPIIGVSLLSEGKDQAVYRVKGRSYKGIFYETPERAIKVFAQMCAYRRFLERN